jgi:hypothetical protein
MNESLSALDPAGAFWHALPPDDYSESWSYLYASEVPWSRGLLDPRAPRRRRRHSSSIGLPPIINAAVRC